MQRERHDEAIMDLLIEICEEVKALDRSISLNPFYRGEGFHQCQRIFALIQQARNEVEKAHGL